MLTIVTYHYVRDGAHARYPGIVSLDTREFEAQLDFLARHFTVVHLDEVVRAARGEADLPSGSCLLTFDDGLLDHYTTVFPRLARRGWSGCFFPVPSASRDHRLLDVHKVQHILAVERNATTLRRATLDLVAAARRDIDLPSDEALWAAFAKPSRYDGPEMKFIKNVLQHGLPQPLRSQIVARLFDDLVGEDEDVLARELYMDVEQMRVMAMAGMAFGGHGSHAWLGRSTRADQRDDFRASRAFIGEITGRSVTDWAMCYPHGNFNDETLLVAGEYECRLGLTTRPGVVSDFSRPLELPRFDTTDLPVRADAAVPERLLPGLTTSHVLVSGERGAASLP